MRLASRLGVEHLATICDGRLLALILLAVVLWQHHRLLSMLAPSQQSCTRSRACDDDQAIGAALPHRRCTWSMLPLLQTVPLVLLVALIMLLLMLLAICLLYTSPSPRDS